jgi:hypothetical protein
MENMELNTGDILAKIVKRDDGYHVIDQDGTESEVLKITKDNVSLILPTNASNRKYYALKKVDEILATEPYVGLTYKATRTLGSTGTRTTYMPNAKLISYLPEEEQEEYKAIIARAIAAKDADKKKPMTELEKAQAAFERAQAKLAKLMEDAEGGNI